MSLETMIDDLRAEYYQAKDQYPEPNPNFKALISEVGELAESLIDYDRYDDNTYDEAIQVAVMALRLAEQNEIRQEG